MNEPAPAAALLSPTTPVSSISTVSGLVVPTPSSVADADAVESPVAICSPPSGLLVPSVACAGSSRAVSAPDSDLGQITVAGTVLLHADSPIWL